jgi:hypothetical protein
VLSRINLSSLSTLFSETPGLDAEWLAVNATVREPLARLEAYQLEGLFGGLGRPFTTWINKPDNVWQLETPSPDGGIKATTRLVALYAADVEPSAGAQIAAGLLDSWSETVPDADQSTTAAFGFDAPAARAPQAILIAVPPSLKEGLSAPVLVDILAETRELAHARMAAPGELPLAFVLPLMMLPGSGITGVPLTPKP